MSDLLIKICSHSHGLFLPLLILNQEIIPFGMKPDVFMPPLLAPITESLLAQVSKADLPDEFDHKPCQVLVGKFEKAWAKFVAKRHSDELPRGDRMKRIDELQDALQHEIKMKNELEIELKQQLEFIKQSRQNLEDEYDQEMNKVRQTQRAVHQELLQLMSLSSKSEELQKQTIPWFYLVEGVIIKGDQPDELEPDNTSCKSTGFSNAALPSERTMALVHLFSRQNTSIVETPLRTQFVNHSILSTHLQLLRKEIQRQECLAVIREFAGRFLTEYGKDCKGLTLDSESTVSTLATDTSSFEASGWTKSSGVVNVAEANNDSLANTHISGSDPDGKKSSDLFTNGKKDDRENSHREDCYGGSELNSDILDSIKPGSISGRQQFHGCEEPNVKQDGVRVTPINDQRREEMAAPGLIKDHDIIPEISVRDINEVQHERDKAPGAADVTDPDILATYALLKECEALKLQASRSSAGPKAPRGGVSVDRSINPENDRGSEFSEISKYQNIHSDIGSGDSSCIQKAPVAMIKVKERHREQGGWGEPDRSRTRHSPRTI